MSFPSTGGVKISSKLASRPNRLSAYSFYADIQLLRPPLLFPTASFRVEIRHNEENTKQSQKKKADGDRIVWHESIFFAGDVTDQSIFYFKIVFARITRGSCKAKGLDLFQQQTDFGSCKLDVFKGCQLIFTIERLSDILPELVNEAKNSLTGMPTLEHSVKIANVVEKADGIFASQEDTWASFLSQFKTFMGAAETISEVHPYAKFAWSILSVIPKTIISQNKRSNSIKDLSLRLTEVYEYITDANRLPTLRETQSGTISVLVQQTIECAYFLREHGTSNTAHKIWKGVDIDEKINDFNKKFDHIINVMTNSITLETGIVTLRASNVINELKDGIQNINDLTLLGEMPYAQNAGFFSSRCCLSGTREGLITEILDWVNGDSPEKLLLLLGQAGTGKSSVAHTIAQMFDKQNRLGSLFCFSRSYKDTRNLLFSTISRQLADGDVQWRRSLVPIVQKTSTRTSMDIFTQFDELIVKPSKTVETIGPVVIIIDGLDESGNRSERAVVLELLFKRCSEFPSNYRFVVTSRPESDIEEWCEHPNVLCKLMTDIGLDETTKDIQRYISSRLSPVANILDIELDVDWRSLLAEQSEGLFQWASTVCNVIDPTVKFGVAGRVKGFVSGTSFSLYQLYHQILTSQPEFNHRDYISAFTAVIGAIVIVQQPLSIQALQSIFQDDINYNVDSILQPLHSLFQGTRDLHFPVRPLHTSLIDFLTTHSIDIVDDKQKAKTIVNPFYIDTSNQAYFTLACLKLMNDGKRGLHFNMCSLETSHIPNQEVPNLDQLLQAAIPSHLSYAIHFWAVHLRQSTLNKKLLEQLHTLMRTNLLNLLEAFSLLQNIEQVCISMKVLAFWCEGLDSELAEQAEDACQFGYEFGHIMMKSTPHLYLSTLPFAPTDSFIRKQYLDLFPHRLNIELGQSFTSQRNSTVIKKHASFRPKVVSFSPRQRYIATGFENGEFWLWDYKTGEMIHQWGPEPAGICSIVFSSDGESVISCFLDGNVKIWNVRKKELAHHSNRGRIKESYSYSTISSDGRYIVFHSYSNIILFYDIATGSDPIRLGFHLNVESTFSPNGELLAFLDKPNTISLWCTRAQNVIGSLRPSQGKITAMVFSPDGNYIGLRSNGTVEIWDVPTRARLGGFEVKHYGNRLMFLSNGHILSSSYLDYCVWDVSTLELVQRFSFEEIVTSFVVSPDCKYAASTMENGTIKLQKWESSLKTSEVVDEFRYSNAQLSPGDKYLILKGEKVGEAYLQISNTATIDSVTAQTQIRNSIVAVSPEDDYIAYVAAHGLCIWSDEGELLLDASDSDYSSLAFSFTGDRLISGDRNGSIIIWDTHTLIGRSYKMASEIAITALAFSVSGAQFLVAYTTSNSKHLIQQDSRSGEILNGPFACHSANPGILTSFVEPYLVAFSAHETRFVCISSWSVVIHILQTFTFSGLGEENFTLSPNREYITWTDGNQFIQLWDIERGVAVEGQWLNYSVAAVGFSSNSENLITMGETGEINFWNINTGSEPMTPIYNRRDIVDNANPKVSSNENYLILIDDGLTKIWSLKTHQIIHSLYERRSNDRSSFGMSDNEVEQFEEVIEDQKFSKTDNQKTTLEYALGAWKKALFSDPFNSEMNEEGWIVGPNEELLFWIPDERWNGLWTPSMTHIGGGFITKLNFDTFVHGLSWAQCRK